MTPAERALKLAERQRRKAEQAVEKAASAVKDEAVKAADKQAKEAAAAKRVMIKAAGRLRAYGISRKISQQMWPEAGGTPCHRLYIAVVCQALYDAFVEPQESRDNRTALSYITNGGMAHHVDLCGGNGEWAEEITQRALGDSAMVAPS